MIRFRYQPTFKNHAAFNRRFVWRRLRIPAFFGGLFFVMCCIQPLAAGAIRRDGGLPNDVHLSPAVMIIPILVAVILVLTHYSIRKAWNKAGDLRAEREFQIDDTGVRVEGPSFSGFLEWQNMASAERTGGYFFLKTLQNQYYYFPESVVPDVRILTDLLARKFPKAKLG